MLELRYQVGVIGQDRWGDRIDFELQKPRCAHQGFAHALSKAISKAVDFHDMRLLLSDCCFAFGDSFDSWRN